MTTISIALTPPCTTKPHPPDSLNLRTTSRGTTVRRRLLLATNRFFDRGDVDFHLLHHGCHRLGRYVLVGTRRQLRQPLWVNLPRHPVAVFEPSAVALLAAIRGQRRPKPIRLGLTVRRNRNRHRLCQREHRPGVEYLVGHSTQRKVDHREGTVSGVAMKRLLDPASRDQGTVVFRSLMASPVAEPEAGTDRTCR